MLRRENIPIFVLLVLIICNGLTYKYNFNGINLTIVILFILSAYKETISDNFLEIYNIRTFKYTLRFINIIELIGAYLMAILLYSNQIKLNRFKTIDIVYLILLGLLNYRFLFYNLSKNKDEQNINTKEQL